MNKMSYSFDLDTFRNMLQICPKLPGQHFVDTPFEEDILAFMRELGYSGTIKLLSDVKVDLLPQLGEHLLLSSTNVLVVKLSNRHTYDFIGLRFLWGLYNQAKFTLFPFMGRLSVSDRKQGVQKEQVHVLPKIHQGHHQPLHVTRLIDFEKEQGGLTHG
ncbi:hypothetical protein Tco_1533542 [Tanacetum coccineum]